MSLLIVEQMARGIRSFHFEGLQFILRSQEKKKYTKRMCRNMLKHVEIKDAESFRAFYDWIFQKGYTYKFQEAMIEVQMLPRQSWSDYLAHVNDKDYEMYRYIMDNIDRIPTGGAVAYDMAYLLLIIHASRRLGYIEQEEEELKTLHVLQFLQMNYADWTEFIFGFSLGKRQMTTDFSNKYVWDYKVFLRHWLYSKKSPFHQIDWRTELT